MSNDNYCVVLTTTSTEEQAEELAKMILANKLAACIQVQKIKSYYVWKGDQCSDPECLLFIKTRESLYEKLEPFILANHKYETPEIVRIPILGGFAKYLNWIDEVTNG